SSSSYGTPRASSSSLICPTSCKDRLLYKGTYVVCDINSASAAIRITNAAAEPVMIPFCHLDRLLQNVFTVSLYCNIFSFILLPPHSNITILMKQSFSTSHPEGINWCGLNIRRDHPFLYQRFLYLHTHDLIVGIDYF